MNWDWNKIKTAGDVMRVVLKIKTKRDAIKFLAEYTERNPHAAANIGYMSGYCDADKMKQIQELFGVEHPVFGKRIPTAKQAFDAGRRMGKDE